MVAARALLQPVAGALGRSDRQRQLSLCPHHCPALLHLRCYHHRYYCGCGDGGADAGALFHRLQQRAARATRSHCSLLTLLLLQACVCAPLRNRPNPLLLLLHQLLLLLTTLHLRSRQPMQVQVQRQLLRWRMSRSQQLQRSLAAAARPVMERRQHCRSGLQSRCYRRPSLQRLR